MAIPAVEKEAVQPKGVPTRPCPRAGILWIFRSSTVVVKIKRAWKWANDEGHLTLNPLSGMKRPKPQRREEIPDEREIALFMRTAKPRFRDLLEFIHETGRA